MLRSLERRLTRAEGLLVVSMLAFMIGMSFLQVVLRAVFHVGILWADTLLRHLVLWVGFLGACLAASADKQFAIDASSRLLRGKVRSAILVLCHLFAAGISALLMKASLSFFREELAHPSVLFAAGAISVPAWIFELILPAAFALLVVHYLLKTAIVLWDF